MTNATTLPRSPRRRLYRPPIEPSPAELHITLHDDGRVRVAMSALHDTDAARVEAQLAADPRKRKLVKDALRLAQESP